VEKGVLEGSRDCEEEVGRSASGWLSRGWSNNSGVLGLSWLFQGANMLYIT